MARRLSGNAEAYDYLAESIRDWPGQRELAARIGAAGWGGVRWLNLSFGVVALHLRPPPRAGRHRPAGAAGRLEAAAAPDRTRLPRNRLVKRFTRQIRTGQ